MAGKITTFYCTQNSAYALEAAAVVAEALAHRIPEGCELRILKPHAAHFALVAGAGIAALIEGTHYAIRPVFVGLAVAV